MDEAEVKALAEGVEEILKLHDRQRENYMKLFKLCLRHLKHKNPFTTKEQQTERKQLIETLEKLTMLGETNGQSN